MNNKKDYVDVVYDENIRPYTDYPSIFIKYLISRYNLKPGSKILELGCGRGEFLNEFSLNGLDSHGIDQSDFAKKKFPKLVVEIINIEKEKLPYKDNYFDIVYSKSFIEHFYYPDFIFQESRRVLKDNGIIITLTPEWQYIYKTFYEDYTHRVPFSNDSLKDIHKINGFKNIEVESFKQLPILFNSSGYIKILINLISEFTRLIVPNYFKTRFKWVRFSKEIMLLSSANK